MADPYLPALADFALNANESAVVTKAMATEKPWDWKPEDEQEAVAFKSAKDRILAYHLSRHGGNCCYCRMNLNGAGPYMTDREHILPKGKPIYAQLSFTMWNLAAACKRCNIQFKRGGDGFVINPDDPSKFQESATYRFIHPNFDAYGTHLTRIEAQVDTCNIVIFVKVAGSEKANYTQQFFALHELQVDSFDKAQGLETGNSQTELADTVRALAKQFEQ